MSYLECTYVNSSQAEEITQIIEQSENQSMEILLKDSEPLIAGGDRICFGDDSIKMIIQKAPQVESQSLGYQKDQYEFLFGGAVAHRRLFSSADECKKSIKVVNRSATNQSRQFKRASNAIDRLTSGTNPLFTSAQCFETIDMITPERFDAKPIGSMANDIKAVLEDNIYTNHLLNSILGVYLY